MQNSTILYILFAIVSSIALVWFQYYFRSKRKGNLRHWLVLLRFIGVLGLLLLLINPKISKNTYTLEKSNLVVVSDNSSSIINLQGEAQLKSVVSNFSNNTDVSDKFNLHQYKFGQNLEQHNDSLNFLDGNTNLGKALKSVQDIYRNTNSAVVILSDGNQTLGEAYEFMGGRLEHPIFPVVIGDTTQYEDLRISQINKNSSLW